MTIEQAVADVLESAPAISALVSTRIYQLKLRQNTAFPAIRVQLISDDRAYHLRGVELLRQARLQIDSYNDETGADPYTVVADVADEVEIALGGLRFTVDNVRVTGAFQVLRRSVHEPGTQPLIRVHQDFRFRYNSVNDVSP